MSTSAFAFTDAAWPDSTPVDPQRVVAGRPETSTITVTSSPGVESGLWRATPGQFLTDHRGYEEFMHIIEGEGELVPDSGAPIALAPGATIFLEDGWIGRWVVRSRVTKAYTIVRPGA